MNPSEFPVGAHVLNVYTKDEWIIVEHHLWWTDVRNVITGGIKRLNSLNNPQFEAMAAALPAAL